MTSLLNRLSFVSLIAGIVIMAIISSCNPSKTDSNSNEKNENTGDSVLNSLNERIKSDPDKLELYIERSKYYLGKSDLQLALADAGRAVMADSSHADWFVHLADIYFARNEPKFAKSALEKSISVDPKQVDALTKLSELYLYLRKYDESISNADLALKADPRNAKSYFLKGMCYKEMGDTIRAINTMQTAVEIDNEYYHAFMQLAMLFSAKRNKLAEDYFYNAIKIDSISPEAWYGLGMFYQQSNQLNKAIQTYTNLIQHNPKYRESYYNLGFIHYEYLKEYHQALKHFDEAVKVDPGFARAVYMRGLCFEALGDINRARGEYNYALKLDPQHELALKGLERVMK